MKSTKTVKGERNITVRENAQGGPGFINIESLITEEQRGEHCGIFSQVTINPGSGLGLHKHEGESETYYILSGSGTYMDNDQNYKVSTGDVLYCADGNSHGILNDSNDILVFIALILKK